jgi:monoamine oxidase
VYIDIVKLRILLESIKVKYIVVGAGLSGLTTGLELLKLGETDFIILEARDRIGGRIKSENGIDFGPTWFQNFHPHLLSLIDELKINHFEQFSAGTSILVHSNSLPSHKFKINPDDPSANRIQGGTIALIESMKNILSDKILTNTEVRSITDSEAHLKLETSQFEYQCRKLILTLPPKLASRINYSPKLDDNVLAVMEDTHTWMSSSIKVGLTFDFPFWRNKNLSGTLISQISPVTELYDHSNDEGTEYSLMGFVNEGMRNETAENRKIKILKYLEKHLGKEINDHTSYLEKDWSTDPFTSTKNPESINVHPQYGNSLFQKPYLNGKLVFSGSETSPVYGGYLEGAVYSGLNAVKILTKH